MDDKMVRIGGELHRRIKAQSALRGMTIQAWVETSLWASLSDQAEDLPLHQTDEALTDAEE